MSENVPVRLAMTIGPTRFATSVLARAAEAPSPITEPEFVGILNSCAERLGALAGLEGGRTVILPATGTVAMEMAALNFVPPGSTIMIISTGYWGERWKMIAERAGLSVQFVTGSAGSAADLAEVERRLATGAVKAVFVTHVDASTGVLADLAQIGALTEKYESVLVVDGICALGCEISRQTRNSVDVYISSSPKAIGVPAGLAFFSLSANAIRVLQTRTWECPSYALDLLPWVSVFEAAGERRFAYFQSPAGNLVMALHESLGLIENEGVMARFHRHRSCRDSLHAGLQALGIRTVAEGGAQCHGVTTCWYPPEQDAGLLVQLRKMGLVLPGGTHPVVGPRTFRIGHLGNVTQGDIDFTVDCLSHVLSGKPSSVLTTT